MTEEQLVETASRLGVEVVAALDSERVARMVLIRLAAEPVVPALSIRRLVPRLAAVLAAAAAILLVVRLMVGTNPTSPTSPTSLTSPSSPTVLHELDELNAAELEALLESLPTAADAAAHPDGAALDQLDSKDLERLLRSLEG